VAGAAAVQHFPSLHVFPTSGDEEITKVLLQQNDVDPDRADTGGQTPLLWAAHRG